MVLQVEVGVYNESFSVSIHQIKLLPISIFSSFITSPRWNWWSVTFAVVFWFGSNRIGAFLIRCFRWNSSSGSSLPTFLRNVMPALISWFIVWRSSFIFFSNSTVLWMMTIAIVSMMFNSGDCKVSVIWCIRCMTFFRNIKLITKSVDISFQMRLKACVFVLTSKDLDVLTSTNVFWITSKLIQTARIDSDRASHLVFDKFLSFSKFSSSFDASSSVSALKGNDSFKTLHNLTQNAFPGDFISYIFVLFAIFLKVLCHEPVAK